MMKTEHLKVTDSNAMKATNAPRTTKVISMLCYKKSSIRNRMRKMSFDLLISRHRLFKCFSLQIIGTLVFLMCLTTSLSLSAQESSKASMARQLLQSKAKADGINESEDLTNMQVSSESFSEKSGVSNVYFQQYVNNIPVYNAILNAHVTKDNKLFYTVSRFISDAKNRTSGSTKISAGQAVQAVAASLGIKKRLKLSIKQNIEGSTRKVIFAKGKLSLEDIPVSLVWQPVETKSPKGLVTMLRLAWELNIYELSAKNWWNVRVDAETGEILDKNNWVVSCEFGPSRNAVEHASHRHTIRDTSALLSVSNTIPPASNSYRVLPAPMESPYEGTTQLVANPSDALASPFGWHDTNGLDGAEFTTTQGNNVFAYTDTDANNLPDIGSSPDGGPSLIFDFPIDFSQEPSTYRPAAVTNLFYWNNYIHDFFYGYGFKEIDGNFQSNNYGRGGAGTDFVKGEAQDGSGTNNANFATPPDGLSPRMQMYIGINPTPDVDGDLDNLIIAHEYGHGISNRLTGGPANTSCLDNKEQMGEGWSDFFGLVLTMLPADQGTDSRAVGNYLFAKGANGAGIRPTAYSTDMAVNPSTYNSIKTAAIPHGVGYVWSTMIWDLTWKLIAKHGYSSGRQIAIQLVTDGLKLQPCRPGFVDGRNAIIAADQALTGADNTCLIWEVFARRGLGFSATQGSTASTTDGTQAFDMPPGCILGITPATQSSCAPSNVIYNLTLGLSLVYPLNIAVSGVPAGAIATLSQSTFTAPGSATLTISNTDAAASGYYPMSINVSNNGGFTSPFSMVLYVGAPSAPVLLTPENLSTNQFRPLLKWSADPVATYELDIATDVNFTNIILNVPGLSVNQYQALGLSPATNYFWRVRTSYPCGIGNYSTPSTFTTANIICSTSMSPNVPVVISAIGTPTITSTLTIADCGSLSYLKVNIPNLTHTWVGDLKATLKAPNGTVLTLFNNPSGGNCNGDNLSVSFEDDAILTAENFVNTCNNLPAISGNYKPVTPFSTIANSSINGVWTLTVQDLATDDGGALNNWGLEICYLPDFTATALPASQFVCSGNTIASIALSSSASDTLFNWTRDNVIAATGIAASGSGNISGILTNTTIAPVTVTFTITPTAGGCFGTPFITTIVVNPTAAVSSFTTVAPICSGATLEALPITSTNGITGTWSPALNNLVTTEYTFTPTEGQCANSATMTITVTPKVTPTFTQVAAVCSGATLEALPITSTNGITGTWSPALNNLVTTEYTFTPTEGQCANSATMTITVTPKVTPTFTQVDSVCSAATLEALPTTSNNAVTGSWSPELNNLATTEYTFTPTEGQCANSAKMTITVTPKVTPTFTQVDSVCSAATLEALPTTSNNAVTGSWSPELNNLATTEYTFTPTEGQCAYTATMSIIVNPLVIYYADNDADGFGNATVTQQSCNGAAAGYVTNNTDCNDANAAVTTGTLITMQPSSPTICKLTNATATVSVNALTAANATYQWYTQTVASTTVWTALTNNANYAGVTGSTLTITRTTTTLPATGTKYRIVISGGQCGNVTSATVALQESLASVAGTISTNTASVCLGGSITYTLSGYVGSAIQWQSLASATATAGTVVGTGASYTATNVSGTALYVRAVVTNGICSAATTAIKTIVVNPTTLAGTITGAGTVCSGGGATLKLVSNVGTVQWKYSTDGISYTNVPTTTIGTAATFATTSTSGTTTTYIVSNVTLSTWFKATVKSGLCNTEETAPVQVIVGTSVAGNLEVTAGFSTTICSGTATSITLSGQTGKIIWQKSVNYYTAATPTWTTVVGTNATVSSGALTNVTTANTVVVFRANVTLGTCGTVSTAVFPVNILPAAKGGKVAVNDTSGLTICSGGSKSLKVTGYVGSLQWQKSTTSATANDFVNVDGATATPYTFSNITQNTWFRLIAKNGSCTATANSTAIAITLSTPVTVGTITAAANDLCPANTGTTLTLSGYVGTITWTKSTDNGNTWATVSGTAPTLSTGVLSITTTFRAKLTSGSCFDYATIVVRVQPLTSAIVSVTASTICSGLTATLAVANFGSGSIQWQKATTLTGTYTNVTTGTGMTSATYVTPALTATAYFRALITNIDGCSSATTGYVVTVSPLAKANTITAAVTATSAATAICTTDPQTLTMPTGSVGNIQWQYSPASSSVGTWTDIPNANATTLNAQSYVPVVGTAVTATYFRAKMTNSCSTAGVYSAAIAVFYKNCSGPMKQVESTTKFDLVAYPNPYSATFNLSLTTTSVDKVGVMVYDMIGKLIDQHEVSPSEVSGLQVGDRYPSGVYSVVVTQGEQTKTVRVVKK